MVSSGYRTMRALARFALIRDLDYFQCFVTGPVPWPAPSIFERSRPSLGATALPILVRGGRGPDCRGTDVLRAAVTGTSANPNRQRPSARPEFEAESST